MTDYLTPFAALKELAEGPVSIFWGAIAGSVLAIVLLFGLVFFFIVGGYWLGKRYLRPKLSHHCVVSEHSFTQTNDARKPSKKFYITLGCVIAVLPLFFISTLHAQNIDLRSGLEIELNRFIHHALGG